MANPTSRSSVHNKNLDILKPNYSPFKKGGDLEEEDDKTLKINRRKRIDLVIANNFKEISKVLQSTTVKELVDIIWKVKTNPKPAVVKEFAAKWKFFDKKKVNDSAEGQTILYAAARNGLSEIVRILIDTPGIQLNGLQLRTEHSESTCLHGANWGGHTEILALLVWKGAKPEKNGDDDDEEALYPYQEQNEGLPQAILTKLNEFWRVYQSGIGIDDFLPEFTNRGAELALINKDLRTSGMLDDPEKSKSSSPFGVPAGVAGSSYQFDLPPAASGYVGSLPPEEAKPPAAADPAPAPAPTPAPTAAAAPPVEDPEARTDPSKLLLNTRFQEVAAQLLKIRDHTEAHEELRELNLKFVMISRDFLHIAKTISKVIISEVYVPREAKTIKPVNVGGIIGGEKYIVQSVLFKFAIMREKDNNAPSAGATKIASKIAGHELKSLSHLWECKVEDVCLPLQCLIDYLGFRMVAMLLLPLGHNTLKVGSSDGGITYAAESPSLLKKFQEIGAALNLAPHQYLNRTLYGPFDLEGHVGKDGNQYIIDFSRLFPPVPPNKLPHSQWYRLFRPEFVKSYKEPLCSDGFSTIVADNPQFNATLVQAEAFLKGEIISLCSNILDDIAEPVISRKMVWPGHFVWNPSRTLHENGINLRYLGLVFNRCKTEAAKNVLILEMAARILKQNLREKIRLKMEELKVPLENSYIELLVTLLNRVLFDRDGEGSVKHDEEWRDIQSKILSYFEFSEVDVEVYSSSGSLLEFRNRIWNFKPTYEKESARGNVLLFDRVRQLMGFKVNKSYLNRLYRATISRLNPLVITGIGQKVKHMNIISHAEGWLLRKIDPDLALKKFETARDSLPLNKYTLRNLANTMLEVETKSSGESLNPKFVKYLEYLYKLALAQENTDTHTLYQYGHFLLSDKQDVKAEEYLIQAIEAYPRHKDAWYSLLRCLESQKDPDFDKYMAFYDACFLNK